MSFFRSFTFASLLMAGTGLLFPAASFAGDHHGSRGDDDDRVPPVTDPLTRQECGACHMPFPAALMPAASWQAVMGDLSNHFGEDASLPPAKVTAITDYLTRNAGRGSLSTGAPLTRISEQGWWVREHRNEVSPRQWEQVGSKANCKACHKGAEQGDFER